jgi:hypothetical protein
MGEELDVGAPSAADIERGLNFSKPVAPKWTMRVKPEMVIGDVVPSWVASIPGPKYVYNIDVTKPRQPVYSMGYGPPRSSLGGGKKKPDPVLPDLVSMRKAEQKLSTIETVKSIKLHTTDRFRPPPKSMSNPDFLDPARAGDVVKGRFGAGKGPVFTLKGRLKSEGELLSVRSPGPIYDPPKLTSTAWTMARRLPTEGDLLSVRSPGPCQYYGPAIDAKKQAAVDSTKKNSPSPGFGIGPRFRGPMSKPSATMRYEGAGHK